MTVIGPKWSTVRGNWTPLDPRDGRPWDPHSHELERLVDDVPG